MMSQKNGFIRYWWKNPDDSDDREGGRLQSFPGMELADCLGQLSSTNSIRKARPPGAACCCPLLLIPVVVIMVWWSAWRWIAQPLEAVVAVAERVAEGDFTSRIEVRSNDEIGNLMHAFSKMQSHLADTIREVNTVTSVASDASQLRASAQTVAQGSQEQSDAAQPAWRHRSSR